MFKKGLLTVAALALSISSAFACWFTQENYENAYFAGVNHFFEHYFNASQAENKDMQTAYYVNGPMDSNGNVSDYYRVNLPITAWFKVSPRTQTVNDIPMSYDIRKARLYFKIVPDNTDANARTAKWYLAKEIDMGPNPRWRLDFKSPVKLFGNASLTMNTITSKGLTIKAGDGIILAWWVADNSTDCIMNADEIEEGSQYPQIVPGKNDKSDIVYPGDYRPAYVMRVVYNGKNVNVGR
jgi:hypothetical protein